ncbi:MAG: class I SAM-dependent methyltransferase [Acidobacteriota bacterium]|nr:class I SAM-dependent methyltransferase [Acidobacteriota bacterium]
MTQAFPDHFSAVASGYASYRPGYPEELFRWLAEVTPGRRVAWDCATGSGQAAVPLGGHFGRVLATDGSVSQLLQARSAPRACYAAATAEAAPWAHASVDLVTVAQALHWFQLESFYREVRRVLRPGGVVAAWCYDLFTLGDDLDPELRDLYDGQLGPYWPPQRRFIDQGYRTLDFPFEEISAPTFELRESWTLEQVTGYLETWSALRRSRRQGFDPLPEATARLRAAWGSEPRRAVVWPVHLRVGRR